MIQNSKRIFTSLNVHLAFYKCVCLGCALCHCTCPDTWWPPPSWPIVLLKAHPALSNRSRWFRHLEYLRINICQRKKNKKKGKRKEKKSTNPPWDEGSLFPVTSKGGRTKMEMTAPRTIVTHLSAIFLMFPMRVYRPQIVCQFSTWSPPYTLFLKYFCQIHLPLLGFRWAPYISLHCPLPIMQKIHRHE